MFRTVVLLMGLAGAAVPASAGEAPVVEPLEIGRTFHLPSRVLGEERLIDVSLPGGYESHPDERYPVLFVLDGEFEGEIAMAIARFYATMSQLPPMIVVAVRNTDRMRDMTPAPIEGFSRPPEARTAGGAPKFLTFLADELLPYVDANYRTVPMRVLIGHSLGGLFTLYTLANRPDLFTGYVVMEPAAWWNNQHEFNEARATLQKPAARRARVMMVNTEKLHADTTQWGGAAPMVRELSTTGETHASMAMAGMMMSLRTMFADFKPSEWIPGTRPIAMLDRYDSLATRLGYEVPIPEQAFGKVFRMSVDSRHFDDAAKVVDRMERSLGPSERSREFRNQLEQERAKPKPANFIPLEFPERRPTPKDAAAFLGRWVAIDETDAREVEVRASGDTIVVHDRIPFPNGEWFDEDDPVIQVTPDGTLEWGLPFFRGLAALVVLRGQVLEDGTMRVTREVRGWVPAGPGADLTQTERFRRITGHTHP